MRRSRSQTLRHERNRAAGRFDDGFILVAVLWLLASLAALASICSAYSIQSGVASRVPDDRIQADAAFQAGVELAAYHALAPSKPQRPTRGAFETKIGQSDIAVGFVSEGARVDLNAASKELLTGLFVALGADKSVADDYASRVVGWRQKAGPGGNAPEEAAYKQAGLTYPPREGPFTDTLELRLVMGLPETIVDRMLPLVTVFSGSPKLDAINAAPEALAALPGVTPEALADVLHARGSGSDGKTLIERLGPAGQMATLEPNESMRAWIVVAMRNGRRVQAEVVFRLTEDKSSPFDILYWRDDFDGPMRQPMAPSTVASGL